MTPPAESERPKRMSLSQVLELVLSRPTHETRSRVTMSLTAKGDTVYEVEGRAAEGQTVDELALEVRKVYETLQLLYPPPNGEPAKASVKLTRNARGEPQIEAEASGSSLEELEPRVAKTFDTLRATFPLSSGFVGATPKDADK